VLAAAVYKGRQVDAFNALLTAGSPSVLAEQRSLLDHLARDQQQLQGVSDLKARYDGQKKPIDQLVADLAKQDADLPHNAAAQRRSMPYVSRANLQIGDLVFYYADLHHVAIYVGSGKIMTAPTFGDFVRMRELDSMPIHSIGRPG